MATVGLPYSLPGPHAWQVLCQAQGVMLWCGLRRVCRPGTLMLPR